MPQSHSKKPVSQGILDSVKTEFNTTYHKMVYFILTLSFGSKFETTVYHWGRSSVRQLATFHPCQDGINYPHPEIRLSISILNYFIKYAAAKIVLVVMHAKWFLRTCGGIQVPFPLGPDILYFHTMVTLNDIEPLSKGIVMDSVQWRLLLKKVTELPVTEEEAMFLADRHVQLLR